MLYFIFSFSLSWHIPLNPLTLFLLSTITLLSSSSVSFPPVSLSCYSLLCCPSHPHFPPHLSLCSDHLLHPHHFTLLSLNSLLSSPFPIHPVTSSSSPVHPVLSPPFPTFLSSCSAASAVSPGVWINMASVLEKCPKIWPVVRDIIKRGVAFPTKCHCRHANPRYWAERIDHLYDGRWHNRTHRHTHAHTTHIDFAIVGFNQFGCFSCFVWSADVSCFRQ